MWGVPSVSSEKNTISELVFLRSRAAKVLSILSAAATTASGVADPGLNTGIATAGLYITFQIGFAIVIQRISRRIHKHDSRIQSQAVLPEKAAVRCRIHRPLIGLQPSDQRLQIQRHG